MIQTEKTSRLEMYPGKVVNLVTRELEYDFECANDVILRVSVISDDIIRLRYCTTGRFGNDFSYGIHAKFKGEVHFIDLVNNPTYYEIQTAKLKVQVRKSNLKVRFLDLENKVLNEDEKGFHWEENQEFGGNIVLMSKTVREGEHYYGMGDKPMHLNLRGKRVQNWGTDDYGFAKGNDPLYKNIPFYIGLAKGKAYGIFFDNSFRSFFDFASERRTATSFWASGGEMNYYFINGPEMIEVSRKYTLLTGTPELPPMWSLGFHQSKWSYYPEKQVRGICSKFRKLKIPCDAIYLDIDYMDGFRCFTWDKEKFPNPKKMVLDLKDRGFKTVVIIDPGIKIDKDYWVYQEGVENNFFCRRADGPFMKGKVWPGECYFPDFTNPKVRKWWASLYKGLVEDVGVKGVWNDMNEPAVFEVESKTFPNDVRFDYDGNPCSHRKAHNVYGMQMAKATLKGFKKYNKSDRPFVITRSGYAGTQRYSSTWTGDNIASWEHLWVASMQVQRMSISGFSFVGSDVGGFTEHPTPELFVRWIQLGVFHPFFRVHSSGDHGVQEPWSFGENATNLVRKFIELRYQLLPYIYSTFYHYVKHGTPMLRPIAFVDQNDSNTLYRVDEFMFGDHLMICPIQEPNAKGRYMYLTEGVWFNFWTDEAVMGSKETWVDCGLEEMPIFVKEGSVIPFFPVMQYVGEKAIDVLDLHIYFTNKEEKKSRFYEDAGEGYDYQEGIYNIRKFTSSGSSGHFAVNQKTNGHYEPSYEKYRLVFHGLPFRINRCKLNGSELDLSNIKDEGGRKVIEVSASFLDIELSAE